MFVRICFVFVILSVTSSAFEYECSDDSQTLYSHPKSCEKFIECNNGIAKEIDCFSGTYFNPSVGYCDFPENVICELEESVESVEETEAPIEEEQEKEEEKSEEKFECPDELQTFFSHPKSCEKFIECNNGIAREINCFGGMYFNPTVGHCDFPENVICGLEESEEVVEETEAPVPKESAEDEEEKEEDEGEKDEEEFECPDDLQTFYSHPKSCEKFIECNNGIAREINCFGEMYFNPAVGFCDFPENVICELEESEEVVGETEEPITEESEEKEVEEEEEKSEEEFECPDDSQTFYSHPKSCEKFIECNNGIAKELGCFSGMHFNPIVGYCDFPENVICQIEESEEVVENTEAPVEEESEEEEKSEEIYECPDDLQTFYSHPKSCKKFIECNYGIAKEIQCFSGTYFNPALGHCDFPENVICDLEENEEVVEETEAPIKEESDDVEVEEEETKSEIAFECPDDSQTYYSHPKSCEMFIECNHGIAKEIECFSGTYYNPAAGYCDFPENVVCVLEESEEVVEETEAPIEEESDEKEEEIATEAPIEEESDEKEEEKETEAPIEEESDEKEEEKEEEEEKSEEVSGTTGPSGECPPVDVQYPTMLTDLGDCSIFYICNWGVPIQMVCPATLHFNPTLNVCDYPANAGCTV